MSKVKKATKKFNKQKSQGTAHFKRKPAHHKKHGGKHAANGVAGEFIQPQSPLPAWWISSLLYTVLY
jgi:hypothetical protein